MANFREGTFTIAATEVAIVAESSVAVAAIAGIRTAADLG